MILGFLKHLTFLLIFFSNFGRFVFAVSFCLAIVLSAYYINEIYGKWKTTPVIFTIDSTATSIRDIPFPAVTICNMNQAQRSRVASIKG